MNEERNEENMSAQEVVLRYEPQLREVVECYVQPTRLPGRKPSAPSFAPPPPHRGLRIFLALLAALLLFALGVLIAWLCGVLTPPDLNDYPFVWHLEEIPENTVETTIERYPNGGGTRLRFEEGHGEELTVQQIYAKVNPSTVTVVTVLPGDEATVGTGVIFTEDGYIVTNAHVIVGGSECYTVLDTGEYYAAKIVGFDEEKDLAVLKVDGKGLSAAEFGDSDALSVGDTVYAIGNPLGVELRGTLTDGIVSAINRDVYIDGVTMTLIQTNAALNNGNSGGPLINAYGQVIGINTMKMGSTSAYSVEGLGFALPISSSAYMIDDLIAFGEIHGEALIGISVLNAVATLPSGESALEVYTVTVGGPGDKAGLQVGDYLVAADGEPLTKTDDLIRIRRRYDAGETLTVTVERGGKRFDAKIILSEEGR